MALFIPVTDTANQTSWINPLLVTRVERDDASGISYIYVIGGGGPWSATETPAQLSAAADAAWTSFLQGIGGIVVP